MPCHHLLDVIDCIDRRVTVVGVDSELIRDVVSGCVCADAASRRRVLCP